MNTRKSILTIGLALIFLGIFGCKEKHKINYEEISLHDYKTETSIEDESNEGFTIISRGMNFELPKKVKSGWQDIIYENRSGDTHFFVLEKLPTGKHLQDMEDEVMPVFVQAMNYINSGDTERGFQEFANLPKWSQGIKFMGGAGLVSSGNTARISQNLKPGNYIIECYVKMPDGTFHSAMGMMEEIEVLPTKTNKAEPDAQNIINISAEKGIVLENIPGIGEQTFQVNFIDQKVYENFLGHDINLVRYISEKDLKKLNDWMNWAQANAFISPAPQNIEFLGGIQEMSQGYTGYFDVELTPGKYALVSEVPDPASRNLLVTFEVKNEEL